MPPVFSAASGTSVEEEQSVKTPISSASTILLVGGSRGIGLEFVKQLTARGASVIATHRGQNPPDILSGIGERVSTLSLDVADEASISRAAAELRSRPGFAGLSHIIHSAGIIGKRPQTLLSVTKESMMEVFSVNCIGPMLVMQYFASLLKPVDENDGKVPIFACLSSKVGSIDDNGSGGSYAYRVSKSAVNQVCRSLSVDLEGRCACVLLHPGWVRTDMTVRLVEKQGR